MQNPTISYDIKMNKGKFKGKIIELNCKLNEVEDGGLDRLLLEYDMIDVICNDNEYEIINRLIEL